MPTSHSENESPPPTVPPLVSNPAEGLRFGDYLSRGFKTYGRHWRQWTGPMGVCACVGLIIIACSVVGLVICKWLLGYGWYTALAVAVASGGLPILLVKGPLACGLYASALKNYRDPPLDARPMRRGWQTRRASVTAGIVLMLFQRVPPFSIAAAIYAVTLWLKGVTGTPDSGTGGALISAGWAALSMAILLAGLAWGFWISTRTMFVVPLVADRGLGFMEALGRSWATTRVRFWELFLVRFLAYVVANLGAYVFLVGILFTTPIYFLVVMAAYEDRFGPPRRSMAAPWQHASTNWA